MFLQKCITILGIVLLSLGVTKTVHAAQPIISLEQSYSMPVSFIPNHGQWREEALYRARVGSVVYWCTENGLRCVLFRPQHGEDRLHEARAIGVTFGASPRTTHVRAEVQTAGRWHFYFGDDPGKWVTAVPGYQQVIYESVYPGINVRYYSKDNHLEYDLEIEPGADLSQVEFCFEGIDSISIDNSTRLSLHFSWGVLRERLPEAVIKSPLGTQTVTAKFEKRSQISYGFSLDREIGPGELAVIDPVLEYCTYLDGSNEDGIEAVAIDNSGCAYVTGGTESTDFPTQSAYQSSYSAGRDAFVAKFSDDGSSLVYCTYMGGPNFDLGTGIVVDSLGRAAVAGYSENTGFPLLFPLSSGQGGFDAILFRLYSTGTLQFSTYLGGSGTDRAYDVDIDNAGFCYVAGETRSGDFPVVNAVQSTAGGQSDAFAAKLGYITSPYPHITLSYSTFIGGTGDEAGRSIAVDRSAGTATIVGSTTSSNFPVYAPLMASLSGGADGFLSRLSASGNSWLFSSFYGGNNADGLTGIALSSNGIINLVGSTSSTNLPVSADAYQTAYAGGFSDVFSSRLAFIPAPLPGYLMPLSCTYLGGAGTDQPYDIAVDASGNSRIVGEAGLNPGFPTLPPTDITMGAFVAKLSGGTLLYSTVLGGTVSAEGVAVTDAGDIYVAGKAWVEGTGLPTTPGAFQESCNTGYTGYLMKLTDGSPPSPAVDSVAPPAAGQAPSYVDISAYARADWPSAISVPTVNGSNVAVYGERGGAYGMLGTFSVEGARSTEIHFEMNYLADSFVVGDLVNVTLTDGITDIYGQPLDRPYTWQFRVCGKSYNTGHFGGKFDVSAGERPTQAVAADMDGDGDMDIVVNDLLDTRVSVHLNDGSGGFGPPSYYKCGSSPEGIVMGDFDRDGDIDAAVTNRDVDSISILRNTGSGALGSPQRYNGGSSPYRIAAGDVNGDGFLDLLTTGSGQYAVSVYINNGDGTFAPRVAYTTGIGNMPYGLVVADFNGDYFLDYAVSCTNDDCLIVTTNDGDGTFSGYDIYAAGSYPWSLCAADVDHDSDYDIVVGNAGDDDISVYYNNGSGVFSGRNDFAAGDYPVQVFPVFTRGTSYGLQEIDIAVACANSDQISVLRNNGSGQFSLDHNYEVGNRPWSVFAADINHDLALDLVTANNWGSSFSVLLGDQAESCCNGDGMRGDVDGTGAVNVSDLTYLVAYLFQGGSSAPCEDEADVDGTGAINVSDLTYLVAYLFQGGPDPMACP